MYYTVYKITNLLNDKYYIGAHKTEDLDDSYFGSGTAIKQAIDKHGKENFRKDILFIYDNSDDMWLSIREEANFPIGAGQTVKVRCNNECIIVGQYLN